MPGPSPTLLVCLLALAGAPACRTEPAPQGLTPLAELPGEHRAALASYRSGAERWERERERWVGDPAVAAFLVDNLVLEMLRAYDGARIAQPGEPRGPFERAQAELVRLAPYSTPVLLEILCTGDGVQAFLAADTLARTPTGLAEPVAACLARPEPEARRRAAELLAGLPHAGEVEDAVQGALAARAGDDPEWIVRAQAVRALAARAARHTDHDVARPALLRALGDADRAVACEAAAALAALGDPRAVPALIDFLERGAREDDLRKLGAAQDALRALTGVARKLDVAGWRAWWSENRASLAGGGGARPSR